MDFRHVDGNFLSSVAVPVCALAWHSIKDSFIVAYIDGVLKIARKNSEQSKTFQAHEVC